MKRSAAYGAVLAALVLASALSSLATPGGRPATGLWRWTEGVPVASTDALAAAALDASPGDGWVLTLPGQAILACSEGSGRLLVMGVEVAYGACRFLAAGAPVTTVAEVGFDGRWVAHACDVPFVRLACDASVAGRRLPVHDRIAGEGLFPLHAAAPEDHALVAVGGTANPWPGSWSWRPEGHEAAVGLRPAAFDLAWVRYADSHVDWSWLAQEAVQGGSMQCVRDHRMPAASAGHGGLALWRNPAGGLAGTGTCHAIFPTAAAPWALAEANAVVEPVPPCMATVACDILVPPAIRFTGEGHFAGPSWAEVGP